MNYTKHLPSLVPWYSIIIKPIIKPRAPSKQKKTTFEQMFPPSLLSLCIWITSSDPPMLPWCWRISSSSKKEICVTLTLSLQTLKVTKYKLCRISSHKGRPYSTQLNQQIKLMKPPETKGDLFFDLQLWLES